MLDKIIKSDEWDDLARLIIYMSAAVAGGYTLGNMNKKFLNMLYNPFVRFIIFLVISASFARISKKSMDIFPVRIILISTIVFWGLVQLLEWWANNRLSSIVENQNTFNKQEEEYMNYPGGGSQVVLALNNQNKIDEEEGFTGCGCGIN